MTATLANEVSGLFEQYRTPLFRYLRSLGIGTQDCEEVIQEVFLALFKHLRGGKPRTNLRGWIFRVGHNQALKVRGRNRLLADASDNDAVADLEPNPEERVLSQQRQRHLTGIIRALPEQDRACLSLRAEGFRYREIAEIVGISLGGVALSLERSLSKLQRRM